MDMYNQSSPCVQSRGEVMYRILREALQVCSFDRDGQFRSLQVWNEQAVRLSRFFCLIYSTVGELRGFIYTMNMMQIFNSQGLLRISLLGALLTAIGLACGAQTFEYAGLNYTVTDASKWTVTLTGAVDKTTLEELDIPAKVFYKKALTSGATENIECTVTAIGHSAFTYSHNLKRVSMANTIETISNNAFSSCKLLEKVDFSENVNFIGQQAFCYCSVLEEITLPQALKTIDFRGFSYCNALRSVTLNEGLETIGQYAFSEGASLTEITIPASVKTIKSMAFYRADGLEKVTFLGPVESIETRAFDYSFNMKYVNAPDIETWCGIGFNETTANPLNIAHNLYIGGNLVKDLTIPATVSEIKPNAFVNCTSLETLKLENSVKKIGVWAFSDCISLTNVDFGTGLEHIDTRAFQNSGLTAISFPESLSIIGNAAFTGCKNVESIEWGNGIAIVGEAAFGNMTSLKSINVNSLSAWCKVDFQGANANPLNYTNAFMIDGTEVTDLVTPDDITEILPYTFDGGADFISVTITDNIRDIGNHGFWGCAKLRDLYIGTGLETLNMYTFGTSYEIKNLHIADSPNPITVNSTDDWASGWAIPKKISNLYIGRNMIINDGTLAPNVIFLTFGPEVTATENVDFTKYSQLMLITALSDTPPTVSEFTTDQYEKIVVKVPENQVDTYRQADVWKNFATITDSPEYTPENISIEFDSDVYDVYPASGLYQAQPFEYTITLAEFSTLGVEFTSEDNALLTFSSAWVPQPKGYGTTTVQATITATGATASAQVNTYTLPKSITLTCGKNLTLHVGDMYQFVAEVLPNPIGKEMITWTSDSEALSIDENGVAHALAEDAKVKVTAKTYNGKSYSTTVSIENAAVTGLENMNTTVNEACDVFSPDGILILHNASSDDLEKLPSGLYIVRTDNEVKKIVR